MATVATKQGPADHGRKLNEEEFYKGDYHPGYKYEIIDGKLYVSPLPNLPDNFIETWLHGKLWEYSRMHPEVINYVSAKPRVFVLKREELTVPEPDLAAYRDIPLHAPWKSLRWQDFSPILVVEVLSAEDPDKDLVRNVALYLEVPSIKEYWVIDNRNESGEFNMTVHRRYRKRWTKIEVAFGETYTTRLLPGFELKLDPY